MENQTSNKQEKVTLTKKQEIINALKFVLFSISAGVIQIVSFTLLSTFVFKDGENKYGISYFISLVLSVLWNFTFNRKFTFKSASNVPVAMLLVFAYYLVFTPLSIWWGNALTKAGWNEYLVLFITMVINMATEFLWTRYVVYRKSINTAQSGKQNQEQIKQYETTQHSEQIKQDTIAQNVEQTSLNAEQSSQSTENE